MAEKKATVKSTLEKGALKKNEGRGELAVILVRGLARIFQPISHTLLLLKLKRKNQCVILKDNPVSRGMLQKVKDFVAWGEISEETFKALVEKRGEPWLGRTTDFKEKYAYPVLEVNGKKYKPYFRLNPPQKGFGRKGIKVAFAAGGGLGYRGEKINDLIRRML